MTQEEKVLNFLNKYKKITKGDAARMGITRLPAIMFGIKKKINITPVWTKWGKNNFVTYWLAEYA